MPPLEGDDEVTERERIKNLTQKKKLLRRVPVLFVQTKTGNTSCKLKNEIRQLKHFNTI